MDKAVYIASPDATVTYYVNGAKSNAIADDAAIAVGAIVDLIDNDNNGKYDVVRITEKTVATVGDNGVTISKATSASKEDAVTIDGIDAIKGVAISRVKGYADLVKGDVVLYVKIGNTFYLETAESVTGVISGSKKVNSTTTGYILGGTTYVASGLKAGSDVVTPFKDFASYNKDLTLYLDNNGSVVKLVLDTEAESKDYAIVEETLWYNQGFGNGYGQAKLILTDGTTEIVTVSKVNNVKAEAGSTANNKTSIKNLTNGNFYAYVIDSNGDYALQTISKSTNTVFADETVITRGVAKFAGSNNNFVGNNATTFIVKSGDKYNVYTGIANVPASKTSTSYVNGTALVNSNKVATFVYMDGANTQEATAQSTVYFLDVASFSYMPESSSGKGDDYYSYDAIVDGKLETVKVTPSFHAATGAGALANGLKAVIYDKSTGYITGYDNGGTVSNAVTGITSNEKAADGTILLGDTYFTYTDDTEGYIVNKETREASISSMDKVAKNAANAVITAVVKTAAATEAKKTTLTALYVEYKPSEGGSSDVTPGIASLTKVELSKDSGLKVTATVSEKAADKMDGTYKIEKYMENTNVWMEVDAGAISVVKEDTIGTATFAEAGDGLYRATVTLSGVTMTSGNFTYVK